MIPTTSAPNEVLVKSAQALRLPQAMIDPRPLFGRGWRATARDAEACWLGLPFGHPTHAGWPGGIDIGNFV